MKNSRTPPSKLSKLLVYQLRSVDCKFPGITHNTTHNSIVGVLTDIGRILQLTDAEDITITLETLVEYTGKGGEDD